MKRFSLKLALIAATAIASNSAIAKPIIVAVIDTGIDKGAITNLCKFGHRSFVDDSPLSDQNGHGTHIAGIINANAEESNYCIVSIKWHKVGLTNVEEVENLRKALLHAVNINVDIINLSGGGKVPNNLEANIVSSALDKNIKLIAAAGNDSADLDKNCDYFPACYDNRIDVVGNLEDSKHRSPSSNYGNYVKHWEVGTNVMSWLPGRKRTPLTGTSQATAVYTGKVIRKLSKSYR